MGGVTIGVVALALPIIFATNQLVERHEVIGIADSAVLAAADALLGWVEGEPCILAQRVVKQSNYTISACVIGDADVTIQITFGPFNTKVDSRAGSEF